MCLCIRTKRLHRWSFCCLQSDGKHHGSTSADFDKIRSHSYGRISTASQHICIDVTFVSSSYLIKYHLHFLLPFLLSHSCCCFFARAALTNKLNMQHITRGFLYLMLPLCFALRTTSADSGKSNGHEISCRMNNVVLSYDTFGTLVICMWRGRSDVWFGLLCAHTPIVFTIVRSFFAHPENIAEEKTNGLGSQKIHKYDENNRFCLLQCFHPIFFSSFDSRFPPAHSQYFSLTLKR